MKIAIIGAGIYGCHLALSLKNQHHTVHLYDRSEDIFSGASTFNSCRIHKGYHYPRSSKTRIMCMRDETEFVRKYPHLITQDSPKIFCVADDAKTLLDFGTMETILTGTALPFERLSQSRIEQLGFQNVEGGFLVYESILMVDKAKSWFLEELKQKDVHLYLNHSIQELGTTFENSIQLNAQDYDLVINCTYSQLFPPLNIRHDPYYDLCFSLILANRYDDAPALSFGIFDGQYPSLEPFGYALAPEKYVAHEGKQIFQLFHVEHTSAAQFQCIHQARSALTNGLSQETQENLTEKMLSHTCHFYPDFRHQFDVIGTQLSLKTKIRDLSDSRPLLVYQEHAYHSRLIQVFSSKLTSIMSAEKQVQAIIESMN
ncbi:FAD-dependent oxidoreductase [Algicola sagamiensis]|uniref:FAD-dependent oxidoreductase n=1 Tax=Algicola sagamiensis TaxID=163869 RepID=UPI00036FB7CE|nr:FAD-dependent oxidoreductase [Algicola sagamiensis]